MHSLANVQIKLKRVQDQLCQAAGKWEENVASLKTNPEAADLIIFSSPHFGLSLVCQLTHVLIAPWEFCFVSVVYNLQ